MSWCDDPYKERRDGEECARRGYLGYENQERLRDGRSYGNDCNREFAQAYDRERDRIAYEEHQAEDREQRRQAEAAEARRYEADRMDEYYRQDYEQPPDDEPPAEITETDDAAPRRPKGAA